MCVCVISCYTYWMSKVIPIKWTHKTSMLIELASQMV